METPAVEMSQDLLDKNAATRAEIERVAAIGRGDARTDWLDEVLASRDLDPRSGILIEFEEVADQGATLCYGTWLAATRTFWAFEVWLDDEGDGEPRVEAFEDIPAMTSTVQHPGIGKSFGAIALEVLADAFPEGR